MQKLTELLDVRKLTLIVELPSNELALAKAAVDAGADVLQLTGNFEIEKDNLAAIVKAVEIPVGYYSPEAISEDDFAAAVKMKFDYLNVQEKNAPPFILKSKKISKVLSLDSRFSLEKITDLAGQGGEALDAAIIPSSTWGKNLVVGDLQNYISIILSAGIPVIIPTERAIKISEVPIIADTGAKGLLLTSVVTGTTAAHLAKAVGEFRAAIDDLAD